MAKAIISTTYNNTYLYFLPIVTYCWNKLGVDVICFMPYKNTSGDRFMLVSDTLVKQGMKGVIYNFDAPEHKEATYAQCLRNYAACLDLPKDEVLITSDVDMAVFTLPPYNGGFTILGADLVPQGQYPQCYVSATVEDWRDTFHLNGITYQQAIDELLGEDECQDYRGCRWSVDQEQLYENIQNYASMISLCNRSNGQNQFAQNRVDRTDTNWRSYVNDTLIDGHLWRDGFTDENHANIMELMRMKFPDEDFTWLDTYRNEYLKLL